MSRIKQKNITPSKQQQDIIDFSVAGKTFKVKARAGTGKSASAVFVAEANPSIDIGIMVFNKSAQLDIKARVPSNVDARTGHSLAFGAVIARGPWRGRDPNEGPFVLVQQIEDDKIIGDVLDLTEGDGRSAAFAVVNTLTRWSSTADEAPTENHVPPAATMRVNGKKEKKKAAETIAKTAGKLWEALSSKNSRLAISHDLYFKYWQLTYPVLPYDMLILDECQPPGTKVMVPDGREKGTQGKPGLLKWKEKNIEDLGNEDLVVSYNQNGLYLNLAGSKVEGFSSRAYTGDLVTISTTDTKTRYTPNHRCIAKIGPALEGKTVVYLMRKGSSFRVGTTSAYHGAMKGQSGVAGRMREEGGTEIWILAALGSKEDALLLEREVMTRFGIPDVQWESGKSAFARQGRLDKFWSKFTNLETQAADCLLYFGRDIRYPIATRKSKDDGKTRRLLMYKRAIEIRACNLMDGMSVLDAKKGLESGPHQSQW